MCKTKVRNSFNIPSIDTSDDNISLDIDVYQEDDITNPSVDQVNEELDASNLLVDFSQYEMLDDDEIHKLQQRLEEAMVEEEEEKEKEDEEHAKEERGRI